MLNATNAFSGFSVSDRPRAMMDGLLPSRMLMFRVPLLAVIRSCLSSWFKSAEITLTGLGPIA